MNVASSKRSQRPAEPNYSQQYHYAYPQALPYYHQTFPNPNQAYAYTNQAHAYANQAYRPTPLAANVYPPGHAANLQPATFQQGEAVGEHRHPVTSWINRRPENNRGQCMDKSNNEDSYLGESFSLSLSQMLSTFLGYLPHTDWQKNPAETPKSSSNERKVIFTVPFRPRKQTVLDEEKGFDYSFHAKAHAQQIDESTQPNADSKFLSERYEIIESRWHPGGDGKDRVTLMINQRVAKEHASPSSNLQWQ